MRLVSIAPMATTIVSAMAFIPAIKTGLAPRTFSWRGKDHAPKGKDHRAHEHQQQNSEMHPSGFGHPNLAQFPRFGRQFHSTERM
jgi:hypothetical protein